MLVNDFNETCAPFPSLGLGSTPHSSAPYAVGNSPILGVSFVHCPRGWVLDRRLPSIPLRQAVKTLARAGFYKSIGKSSRTSCKCKTLMKLTNFMMKLYFNVRPLLHVASQL